jgi:protein-tyrosine phosphatase
MGVLFVCTGNYYRSRFAELYFNHLAGKLSVPLQAFSRGLEVYRSLNEGNLSPHTLQYLSAIGVPVSEPLTGPKQLQAQDLGQASLVVVLDETEHRPMVKRYFPEWEEKAIYWQFEDDYLRAPEQVLPALKRQVSELLESLSPSVHANTPPVDN